jgi:glycosyltransferase 2 family protein
MNKKKFWISALVLLVLAALIYFQVRTWQKFDWEKFWAETRHTRVTYILGGVALIYADYYLRSVRWKILLRPVCKTKASHLLAPTMIGFTGLALLGRPGEFVRPYLIARKTNLSMSSQVAVWLVERIFDMGAFALIMAINILWSANTLRQLPGFAQGRSRTIGRFHISSFGMFELSGAGLLVVVAAMACVAFFVRKNPSRAARIVARLLGGISEKLAGAVSRRVQAFGEGLNTIENMTSFLQLAGLSLLIWLIIGFSYVAVTHAYRIHRLQRLTLSGVLLLTAASVIGGVVQLPVVGGGSQLATIGMLRGVFHVSPELSISCGIMLWLVTFMSVIPAGLFLAHREHVSLRRLEQESEEEIGSPEESGDRVIR